MDHDDGIRELGSVLHRVYTFVGQAEAISNIINSQKTDKGDTDIVESQLRLLKLILNQTSQCAHFIISYTKDANFCVWFPGFLFHYLCFLGKRTTKNLGPQVDASIQEYLGSFQKLLDEFQANANLLIEMSVLQIKFITLGLGGKLNDIGKIILGVT